MFTSNGTLHLKRYLGANTEQALQDVWTNVPPVNSKVKERTGYLTQNPYDLLTRIIELPITRANCN